MIARLSDSGSTTQVEPRRPAGFCGRAGFSRDSARSRRQGVAMQGRSPLRVLEVACWITGTALLALSSFALIGGEVAKKQAVAQFVQARAAHVASAAIDPAPAAESGSPTPPSVTPAAVPEDPDPPIALLLIPRVEFEVPVFGDTSERNLNRGAGWIKGTASPEEDGNVGIAGHRDRYFRVLKDVVVGDVIELDGMSDQRTYRVTKISIVRPEDNSSLRPTDGSSITLVTCYPFYYVGHAPKRYVVRAVETSETARAGNMPESTER